MSIKVCYPQFPWVSLEEDKLKAAAFSALINREGGSTWQGESRELDNVRVMKPGPEMTVLNKSSPAQIPGGHQRTTGIPPSVRWGFEPI